MNIAGWTAAAILGYLLGCVPCGVLIGRFYGRIDIRKTGSGNSGTTNMLRTLGWLPSVMTLVGDALKGALAALLGRALGGETGMFLAAFCAVLGHDFPIFSRFKGGKGIATSLGVTFVIAPKVAPCLVAIVFAIVGFTGLMSLGTLTASVAYPVLYALLRPKGASLTGYLIFSIASMLLSFFCHRGNLSRLARGEENRLDFGRIRGLSGRHFRRFRERMHRQDGPKK